jgi:hypothetical protein
LKKILALSGKPSDSALMKTIQTPAGKYKVPGSVIKTLERNQKWIDDEHTAPAQAQHSPIISANTKQANAQRLADACQSLIETYVPETEEGYSDIGGIVHQAREALAEWSKHNE